MHLCHPCTWCNTRDESQATPRAGGRCLCPSPPDTGGQHEEPEPPPAACRARRQEAGAPCSPQQHWTPLHTASGCSHSRVVSSRLPSSKATLRHAAPRQPEALVNSQQQSFASHLPLPARIQPRVADSGYQWPRRTRSSAWPAWPQARHFTSRSPPNCPQASDAATSPGAAPRLQEEARRQTQAATLCLLPLDQS